MDLNKVREAVNSLNSYEYVKFMNELHFNYPRKTRSLTNEIVKLWKSDYSMKTEEFNDIVNERKAEHGQEVKAQRQVDLKRIQDMKSTTGSEPLQIFPKEIWMMMLEKLVPEDKRSVREIHQLFRDLTDDKLIGDILFPLILGIRGEWFWGDEYPFPNGFDEPSCCLAQLSELRLVSKSLRNAVDRWYEDSILSLLRNGDKNACASSFVQIDLFDVNDRQKFSKAELSDSVSPKPQRLFHRSLYIVSSGIYDEDEEHDIDVLADFPQIIDAILDYFGDQIWHFRFEFHHPCKRVAAQYPPARLENCYKILLGWLSRMPNLKWLSLNFDESEKATKKDRFMIPEGLPPPCLKHLERLDFVMIKANRYLMPIYNGFLSANPQVKILNLDRFDFYLDEHDDDAMVLDAVRALPSSLEDLKIKARRDWDGDSDDDEEYVPENPLNNCMYITSAKYPLKRIDLEMNTVRPSSIFWALGKFNETLEKVTLTIEDLVIRDDIVYLLLPNLTHFEFNIKKPGHLWLELEDSKFNWSFFFSLQFLVYAKKLTNLIWKCDMSYEAWDKVYKDMEHNRSVGELLNFGAGLWLIEGNSNLWRAFPWLNKVKVDRIVRVGIKEDAGKKSFSNEYRRCDRELDDSSSSPSCSSVSC